MMTWKTLDDSRKEGGPAFPGKVVNISFSGMTLRDYFAAKAMASLLVNVGFANEVAKNLGVNLAEYASQTAYAIADEMLEARK